MAIAGVGEGLEFVRRAPARARRLRVRLLGLCEMSGGLHGLASRGLIDSRPMAHYQLVK